MQTLSFKFVASKRRGQCLAAALAAIHVAGYTNIGLAQAGGQTTPADIARPRSVQAVAVQAPGPDGRTSWIIEPDVPRIPKIEGLNAALPQHIQRRLEYAFDLAQRGATYSASAEFQGVIGLCALELDAKSGDTRHRDALCQGWTALHEADDFEESQTALHDPAEVQRIAANHSMRLLGEPSTPIDSMQAVQTYYAFAEERLASACSELPGASLAFYGLGRTFVIPGSRITHGAAKAALLQRVALSIAPQNVLAGNELGVLLAQHGHLAESERLFRECVAVNPRPETWQNLAAVCAQQGDHASSHAAAAAGEALAAEKRLATNGNPAMNYPNAESSNELKKDKRKAGLLSKLSIPNFRTTFKR